MPSTLEPLEVELGRREVALGQREVRPVLVELGAQVRLVERRQQLTLVDDLLLLEADRRDAKRINGICCAGKACYQSSG